MIRWSSVGLILEGEISTHNLPTVSTVDLRIANLAAAKLLAVNRLLDIIHIDKKNSSFAKKMVCLRE